MNIFRRLRNLWKLSEYEPEYNHKDKYEAGDVISPLIKKKKQAKVVDMHDPLSIDLGDK